jgi:hypothetical protein
LENAWAKPSTFDVEDAAEEPTMCRKKDALRVAMAIPQKLGAIRGKTRKSLAKEPDSCIKLKSI